MATIVLVNIVCMHFDFNNSRNKTIQQIYNISDREVLDIVSQLPPETEDIYQLDYDYLQTLAQRVTQTYLSTVASNVQQQWIESYNAIKDPSWHECQNYQDLIQLPRTIKNECIKVHGFDPESWLRQATQPRIDQDWFSVQPIVSRLDALIRYQHVVLDNLDIIKGANIVEFAADNAFFSFASLHHGAESVLATEVLPQQANKIAQTAHKYGHNNFLVCEADIYKYEYNTQICCNKDLVFLCGILNHVNDHYNIIKSVCQARPTWLIVETELFDTKLENSQPSVFWRNEFSYSRRSGHNQNSLQSIVGLPNTAWFDLTLGSFGYQSVKFLQYTMWHGQKITDHNKLNRVIYVYKYTG
jgi:predicted nicotinamide N-methyase